jgi:hypothetical protein
MYYFKCIYWISGTITPRLIAWTNSIDDLKNSIIYSIKDCVFLFLGKRWLEKHEHPLQDLYDCIPSHARTLSPIRCWLSYPIKSMNSIHRILKNEKKKKTPKYNLHNCSNSKFFGINKEFFKKTFDIQVDNKYLFVWRKRGCMFL